MIDLRLPVAAVSVLCVSATWRPEDFLTDKALLVRVVCAEALRAPRSERRAVMGVALDRVASPGWWGGDLREVLLAPRQFASPWSPWCGRTLPDRDDGLPWSPGMMEMHDRLMAEIREDAESALEGRLEAPLPGATYFHAKDLGELWPWLEEVPTPDGWWHRFYKERQ